MSARGLLSWFLRRPRSAPPAGDTTTWIDAADLAVRLARGARPLLIDVRGADEFTGDLGHIEGARNIALASLPQQLSELEALKAAEIVLICKTQIRSAKAATLLQDAGFGRVAVLRGGMVEWARQQRPVAASG